MRQSTVVVSSAGLGPENDCSGKEAIVRVNYRSILSSERAPHTKKPAIANTEEKKSGHEFQMGARHQDRLAD
jgi:hypothetical protein